MVRASLSPFVLVVVLLLALSCSSGGKGDRQELRRLVGQRDYAAAHALLDESKFYQEESSALLYQLEKGILFHLEGNYLESIKHFESAQKISRDLFTVSLSSASKTLVANDNYDLYYGAPYERSHIHFYQSLNYFFLSQNEAEGSNQKQNYLFSARAEILAWDAILSQYRQEGYLGGHFQNDLMAKMYGGLVHEAFNTRDEQQIALQLYKDALDVLLKQYNSYPNFNSLSENFLKDFDQLKKLPPAELQKKYIQKTTLHQQLERYIKKKIVLLTKALFPRDLPQTLKRYSIPSELVDSLGKQTKLSNVVVLLHEGLIPEKKAAEQYIGFDYAKYESEGAQILAAIGSVALTLFATERLGLAPAPTYWTPAGAQLGLDISHELVKGIAISFELPKVESSRVDEQIQLEALSQSYPIPLVQPLGDIAQQAVALDAVARYARVGGRLLVKHLGAIAASYASYQAMRKDGDESRNSMALGLATLQYVAAAKAIRQSEQADTRYWSLLPQNLWLYDLHLPAGEHDLHITISDGGGQSRRLLLGKVSILENHSGKILLSPRIF